MAASSVGQRFSQLIQQLGMSKNAFALSLDKTATVIQHLVDERNKPGFDLMCKVFEVYPNVSKDWLLLGSGPMLLNAAVNSGQTAVPEASEVAAAAAPPRASAVSNPPASPSFPAPLFSVSSARPPLPEVPAPSAAPAAPPASDAPASPGQPVTPALGAALPAPQPTTPPPAPSPVASAAPSASLDAATLTAALHAQYLQHQLALAEQRNQHLLEQQQLMQQMLDLLRRPA